MGFAPNRRTMARAQRSSRSLAPAAASLNLILNHSPTCRFLAPRAVGQITPPEGSVQVRLLRQARRRLRLCRAARGLLRSTWSRTVTDGSRSATVVASPVMRRPPAVNHPASSKPWIPRWLLGRCFKCLDEGHQKVSCSGEIRCHKCWVSGHIARDCTHSPSSSLPQPPPHPRSSQGHSSSGAATHRPRPAPAQRPHRRLPPPLNMAHYRPLAHQRFPGELLTHGDPDLRPERGGGIVSRRDGRP